MQESYDNLKNLFTLLAEGEVKRVNSEGVDNIKDHSEANSYSTTINDKTIRILPENITITQEEISQIKQKLEDFYFDMKMLNSARESFLKHSSDEMKEEKLLKQIEIDKKQANKAKKLNFVYFGNLKAKYEEELRIKGKVDYILADIMESPVRDEYGNWYYEGYIG